MEGSMQRMTWKWGLVFLAVTLALMFGACSDGDNTSPVPSDGDQTDGDQTTDGDVEADGDVIVDGDQVTDGDMEPDSDQVIDGDMEMDGDDEMEQEEESGPGITVTRDDK